MAAWITARQASRLYGVQLGTIYAWASQDNWRRTPHRRGSVRPIEYCWEDAQASYERRHGVPQTAPRHDAAARLRQRPPEAAPSVAGKMAAG